MREPETPATLALRALACGDAAGVLAQADASGWDASARRVFWIEAFRANSIHVLAQLRAHPHWQDGETIWEAIPWNEKAFISPIVGRIMAVDKNQPLTDNWWIETSRSLANDGLIAATIQALTMVSPSAQSQVPTSVVAATVDHLVGRWMNAEDVVAWWSLEPQKSLAPMIYDKTPDVWAERLRVHCAHQQNEYAGWSEGEARLSAMWSVHEGMMIERALAANCLKKNAPNHKKM